MKVVTRFVLRFLSFCLLFPLSLSTRVMAQEPDLIVFNGKIASVDEKPLFQKGTSPTAGGVFQAMAVGDGTVIAVGRNEEILRLAGTRTKKLDVQGRTVLPGLIDPHAHRNGFLPEDFPEVQQARVQIPPSGNREEVKRQILEALRDKAAKTKGGEWIILNPTGDVARELILFNQITRGDLDRLAPDHFVMLNETGSGPNSQIVFNTRARKLLERELPGFRYFSDQDIKGDGVNVSILVTQDVILKGKEERYAESLKKMLIRLLRDGTTAGGSWAMRTALNAYMTLDRKGEMPWRFAWIFCDGSYYNGEGFYRRFPDFSLGGGSRYLWSFGNGEEVVDSPSTGLCTTVPIINRELKERFEKSGVDTCFLNNPVKRATVKDQIEYGRGRQYHASGDKTVDLLLGIIEEIRRETGMTAEQIKAKRITMEHLHMVREDQYPKLKEYGVVMGNSPGFMTDSLNPKKPDNVIQNFGEQYLKWMMPAKGFIDNGVYTVLAEYGGFSGIERMVTREVCFTPRLPGEGEIGTEKCKVLAPEQAIDRATALKMATSWPAYYMLRENEMGSLEVGKWADFIVIDRDYFTIPEKEISDIRVLLTVLGGKVVYASPNFGPIEQMLFKSPEYYGDAQLASPTTTVGM
ncbi:MAG: amidohydrolase family protein [Acidobacteria bacterium]|nr:amidohydrolase family protein [Acidobacteriota bacterium]